MKNEQKFINTINSIIRCLFWIPFVIGFVGYAWVPSGPGTELLSYGESVYAALALYFVNPVNDNMNICILIAGLSAIFVTTSFVLSVLSKAFKLLLQWYKRIWQDSTAIYTEKSDQWSEILVETIKHGYIAGTFEDDTVEKTKDHIIMFKDDMHNLNFYKKNKDKFGNGRVYIMLTDVDSFLIGVEKDKKVHYFDVNDLIARIYWKRNNLYNVIGLEKPEKPYKLAIVGNTDIKQALFKYAYLNNIYSLNQSIEYHLWGTELYEIDFLNELKLDNDDKIIIHEGDYRREVAVLAQMDRVILTEEGSMPVMQELLYINPMLQIHCYNNNEVSFTTLYMSNNVLVFGDVTDILTEENIKDEKLYRQAKLINLDYILRYSKQKCPSDYETRMEEEWGKLNGFTKGSNIARADFYWIEKKRLDEGAPDEMIWRMEHIRWCRYHYFNRWEYAPVRNNELHKHNLLVPFDDLPQSEKEKDGIYDPEIKKEIIRLMEEEFKSISQS